MIYEYEPLQIFETREYSLVSFDKCSEIDVEGNITDKEIFKKTFHNGIKIKPLKGKKTEIIIYIKFDKPRCIGKIYFNGGNDNRMVNSCYIDEIKGLDNKVWKEINEYTDFSQIRIKLSNKTIKNVYTYIEKFSLLLKSFE